MKKHNFGLVFVTLFVTLSRLSTYAGGANGGGGGLGHSLFVETSSNIIHALKNTSWGKTFASDNLLDANLLEAVSAPDRVKVISEPLYDDLGNRVDALCRNGQIQLDHNQWTEFAEKQTSVRLLVFKEIARCANYNENNQAITLANAFESIAKDNKYMAESSLTTATASRNFFSALSAAISGQSLLSICNQLRKDALQLMTEKCNKKGFRDWNNGYWLTDDCMMNNVTGFLHIKVRATCHN